MWTESDDELLDAERADLVKLALRAAADSMVITYVIHAIQDSYDPSSDQDQALRRERTAGLRLTLYEGFVVVPEVLRETKSIDNPETAERHDSLRLGLMYTVYPTGWERSHPVIIRTQQLNYHHQSRSDCRAVAQSEALGLQYFVTFDRDMIKHLAGKTAGIEIITPSSLWRRLKIPAGTPPRFQPHPTNRMWKKSWWLAGR